MKSNPCKVCGSVWHTAMYHKRSALKTNKPLSKLGKVARKTQKSVREWKSEQQTNHEGYYECFYCDRWIDYLTAEHTLSKARNPQYRTDKSKFVITCDFDNQRKGSMDAEDYIRKFYPDKLNLIEKLS